MKYQKHRNLSNSNLWGRKDLEDSDFEKLFKGAVNTDEDRSFLHDPSILAGMSSNHYGTSFIASSDFVKIIRETMIERPENKEAGHLLPQIVLAPIGAINADNIIKHTAPLVKNSYTKIIQQQTSRGGNLSGWRGYAQPIYRDYWGSDVIDSLFDNTVSTTGVNTNTDYGKGIVSTLKNMINNQWDEKILALFFSLNRFLDPAHDADQGSTFEEFTKNNAQSLDEEFMAFNGKNNKNTSLLLEAWGRYSSAIYPMSSNVNKVKKSLDPLSHDQLVQLMTAWSDPKAHFYGVSTNNQITVIQSAIDALNVDANIIDSSEGKNILANAFLRCDKSQGVTPYMFSIIYDTINNFCYLYKKNDVYSSAIVEHIDKNAESMTFTDLAALLFASSEAQAIMSNGNDKVARSIVYKLLTDSRDPQASVDFIISLVTDYEGSLPTKVMWDNLIESDRETEELNISPNLALAISDTSVKSGNKVRLMDFRRSIQRAVKG